ncbi:hypothetical protein CMI37_19505 [Candidatus Pacearchaeota archaeon]|nr:hypothetical protein [Candidatus Pacearchaeota archaeon]|tara:strand:- start:1545 stop:2192 length:648 start_codon:yes stop_codon:yes gene_type:complete
MADEKEGTQATAEGTTPKPEVKVDVTKTPEFKQALSNATSAIQKQTAEANKLVKGLTGQVTSLTSEVEVLRLAGDDPEALEAARTSLKDKQDALEIQRQAQEQVSDAQTLARQSTQIILAAQYKLELADLEQFESLADMQSGAKDLYIARLEAEKANGAPPVETEAEQESSNGFDTAKGSAVSQGKNWPQIVLSGPEGRKEFQEHLKSLRANTRR